MSSVKYEFRYMPLIGKLSGESMLQQTETAINEIAEIVNENTAQADIINTLAQDANDNSVEALEKANEALETSSRVYIHEELAVNLDSYCESQLIYVANISSTNLPIAKKGFLEVKTDDDKTECVQLFVSDDKDVYVRSGSITAETVGDITVYTADFEEWTSLSSPTILLQAGNGTSIPLSADLNDYNTEGTFYCSTTNVGSIAHCPVSEGEFKLIVMKFATANYGLQMLYPSVQHLYVRKYSGGAWGNWEVIVPKITSGVTNGSIAVNDTDVSVTGWNTKADLDSPVFVGTPTAPTPANNDNSTKLATTEFVNSRLGNYLPLTGGTMSGAIVSSITDIIKQTTNTSHTTILGGTAYSSGASLVLRGGDEAVQAGAFQLKAQDGSVYKDFIGFSDGTLKWGGNNVITSAGGTLNNRLNFKGLNNRSVTVGTAPSSTNCDLGWNDSAILVLRSSDYGVSAGQDGAFELMARSNNGGTVVSKTLFGTKTGILTWGGQNILTAANYNSYALPLGGGTMTGTILSRYAALKAPSDDTYIEIDGGTGGGGGAGLLLFGKDESRQGLFWIRSRNGTAGKDLVGKPDGTLTWNGQPIQTSSDKRLKQDFSNVPAEVLEAWGKVNWQQFKYKEDVERKGENCRFHTGLVAQDVKEVGEENNIDLLKYGILCHDVREAVEEEKDEDGNIIKEASEAVDLWTVRYEEALAMEVIYLRNEIKKLREEIKALRTE